MKQTVQTMKNIVFIDLCSFISADNAIFTIGAGAHKCGKNTLTWRSKRGGAYFQENKFLWFMYLQFIAMLSHKNEIMTYLL